MLFRAIPYSSYRSDPLAADKPGEELLPEAAVWTIYKPEATEYDNELVKGRNENLDTMLLFAALFSAILTAFLIESTSLLQEDPAETSVALLSLLVQSNLGAMNMSSILPGSSSFTPELSARWVNGLWFAALSLSLAATLLAMLAKEWLDAFTASHKRAPHAYAISRQARLDGFEAWGAPQIMDMLPTLLHLSLLLFALGLVVYLWSLDRAIAIMLSCIIGITSLLYVGTVVCGAVYEFCPFVTRLSRYLKLIIQSILSLNTKDCDEEGSLCLYVGTAVCGVVYQLCSFATRLSRYLKLVTRSVLRLDTEDSDEEGSLCQENPSLNGGVTVADLRALTWLAEHACDQENGDSAYQALAGLSTREAKSLVSTRKAKKERQKLLTEAREVTHFLRDYAARFHSTLTESPQELAKCRGENIIRYAQALPGIVNCVDTFLGDLDTVLDQKGRNHASIRLKLQADRVMSTILEVVDTIWSGEYELSASTYAHVAASELRYAQAIITNGMVHNSPEVSSPSQRPATGNEFRVIGIDKPRGISSAQLWAHYNAALGCAGYLIISHLDPMYCSIKPRALLDLLSGIETTATFIWKHSADCYRSPLHDRILPPIIYASLGSKKLWADGVVDSRSGLVWLLDSLLALSSAQDLPSDVRDASTRAMHAVSVLNTQHEVRSNDSDSGRLSLYKGQSALTKAVVNLAFCLASRAPSLWLLGKALNCLLDAIKHMDSTSSKGVPGILGYELTSIMQLETESMSSWSEDARASLIQLLAFELPDDSITGHKTKTVLAVAFYYHVRMIYSDSSFQKSVSWLLSLIQQTRDCVSEVNTLLSELIKLLDDFDIVAPHEDDGEEEAIDNPYVIFFTETPGFHELVTAGERADYTPLVAQTVIRLCINSHFQHVREMNLREILKATFERVNYHDLLRFNQGWQLFQEYKASPLVPCPPTISPVALPGFLDALTLALDYIQSNELRESPDAPEFVECAMKLLNVSLVASCNEFDSDCGIRAGQVARRLCEYDTPKLDEEAVDVVARYCRLPMQTAEEVANLDDQSISHTSGELNPFQAPSFE